MKTFGSRWLLKGVGFVAGTTLSLATGHAMTLTTPYDLGTNTADWSSPNGDTAHRLDPALVAPSDSQIANTANQVNFMYSIQGQTTPPITYGAALSGEAQVRQHDVLGFPANDRFAVGGDFQVDYVGADQADLRWIVTASFQPAGYESPSIQTADFRYNRAFYYSDSQDPDFHDAANNTYHLPSAGNLLWIAPPGDYVWDVYAVPVTLSHDVTGALSGIEFHDAIHLSEDVHLAAVPEPASIFALGLGFLPLLRRKNRR